MVLWVTELNRVNLKLPINVSHCRHCNAWKECSSEYVVLSKELDKLLVVLG